VLKSVHFANMRSIHFSVAICQLFAPVLSALEPASRDAIRDLTIQNAKDGLDLYYRYRALYTNRYQPPLLAFCLVHLADTIVRYSDPQQDGVVKFCLETLSEASGGFQYILPLQAMFCETVRERGLPLPPPSQLLKFMNGRSRFSLSREEKLDCCERLTYAQPVDLLRERLDPKLAEEFELEWRRLSHDSGVNASRPSGIARSGFWSSTGSTGSDGRPGDDNSANRALRIQRFMNP
jgi:hypothetical protein